jgi:hypothetical protein
MSGVWRVTTCPMAIALALACLSAVPGPAAMAPAASATAEPGGAVATRSFDLNGHSILVEEKHDRAAARVSARVTLDDKTIFPERTTTRAAARRGLYGPFQPPSKQFMVFAYAAGDESQLIVIRSDGASQVVGGRAGAFDPYEKTFVHDPGFGLKGIAVLDLGTMVDTQVNHDLENIHGWYWRRGMLHLLTCRPDDPAEKDCAILLALKPEHPRDTGKRTALCPWDQRDGVGCVDRYTGYATATPARRLFPELDGD